MYCQFITNSNKVFQFTKNARKTSSLSRRFDQCLERFVARFRNLIRKLIEASPLGFTVVYIFDEASPTHSQLKPAFELISRESAFSQFFTMSWEDCEEEVMGTYHVETFPSFLVFKGDRLLSCFAAETCKLLRKFGNY